MRLAADVRVLYVNAEDPARSALNDAIFKRHFVDEDGVHGADLREPFGEIVEAAELHAKHGSLLQAVRTNSAPSRGGRRTTRARGATSSLSHLAAVLGVNNPEGSTKRLMADLGGFEPPRALTQPAFQASAIGH